MDKENNNTNRLCSILYSTGNKLKIIDLKTKEKKTILVGDSSIPTMKYYEGDVFFVEDDNSKDSLPPVLCSLNLESGRLEKKEIMEKGGVVSIDCFGNHGFFGGILKDKNEKNLLYYFDLKKLNATGVALDSFINSIACDNKGNVFFGGSLMRDLKKEGNVFFGGSLMRDFKEQGNGVVYFFNPKKKELSEKVTLKETITSIACDNKGNVFIGGTRDNQSRLYSFDLEKEELKERVEVYGSINQIVFSDKVFLGVNSYGCGELYSFDLKKDEFKKRVKSFFNIGPIDCGNNGNVFYAVNDKKHCGEDSHFLKSINLKKEESELYAMEKNEITGLSPTPFKLKDIAQIK
jgi:hypothetical protein